MKTNNNTKVAFVGMTHLGLIHAVAFSEKGFSIYGFDYNQVLIEQLNHYQLSVNEPQLNKLMRKNKERLYFTANPRDLADCDVVFISCDVPTDDEGKSHLAIIEEYVQKTNRHLNEDAALVILSQVPPGFTRRIQRRSEKLFYQVETLVFGQAIDRALYPERYMVGMSNPANDLPEAYQLILAAFECPILKMKYESAELAKISINMFLVASVTTTNTIAELCEQLGADWDEIAPSLRLDRRIGKHAYLSPGLGISGGNLERDLNTFIRLGTQHHTDVSMVKTWVSNSKYRKAWVFDCLTQHVLSKKPNPKISILGLAYKPNTHSVKNSPSFILINHLKGLQVHAHDPIVTENQGAEIQLHQDIDSAIQGSDVLIIMLACEEYKKLNITHILSLMRGKTIIDPFQTLKLENNPAKEYAYFCLGKSVQTIGEREETYA